MLRLGSPDSQRCVIGLLEVISILTDSIDRDEHTPYPRDQQGKRRNTRMIVSMADAAATLPHSKLRDTRLTNGQGHPSNQDGIG
mgnify:CR=1 FL=1|jgi:hypothetical protein